MRAGFAAAIVAVAVATGPSCGRRASAPAPPPATEETEAAAPGTPAIEGKEGAPAAPAPIPKIVVTLYFPSAFGDILVGERREIFKTTEPGDRAKQILSDLIAGPVGTAAARAVPDGTSLRQVFVTPTGVAWLDFTTELRSDIGGGSSAELMTVYAIVDSIALNIPEIRRVGILVDGRPIETLNGHMDLRRPLPPRRDLVRGAEESARRDTKRPNSRQAVGAAPRMRAGHALGGSNPSVPTRRVPEPVTATAARASTQDGPNACPAAARKNAISDPATALDERA